MKVTDKDVAYVADLANLELSDEERVRMLRDLNSFLSMLTGLASLRPATLAHGPGLGSLRVFTSRGRGVSDSRMPSVRTSKTVLAEIAAA